MRVKDAAAYLSESESNFRKLVMKYPDRLRPFNFSPNADQKFSREELDEFIRWRLGIGRESA